MRNVLIIVCFLFCQIAYAESSTKILAHPIKIKKTVYGTGNVSIVLNKQRFFDSNTNHSFYQGMVKVGKFNFPVSASIISQKLVIKFPGKITGSSGNRQRHYTLQIFKGKTKTSSIPHSVVHNKICSTTHATHFHEMSTPTSNENKLSKILTISTYADQEFEDLYKQNTNSYILSLLNDAETLYKNSLNIEFQVLSQNKYSTIKLEPSEILSEFRDNTLTDTQPAVKYLFTGKDMTGLTIGIAYVGVVCYSQKDSVGVVQDYSFLTGNVFAHELGHNLGASHDTSQFGNIMYPSVNFGQPYFTQNSINQILSHLSYFSQCLFDKPEEINDLQNAKLSLKMNKKTLFVTFLSELGVPLSNKTIFVYHKTLKKNVTTSSNGVAKVALTRKGRYYVFAQSIDNTKIKTRLVVNIK